MRKSSVTAIIFAIIIVSPVLFQAGFAVRKSFGEVYTCEEACKKSSYTYLACDEGVCFCDSNESKEPVHLRQHRVNNETYPIVCQPD